jgi:hypothetical protein
MVHVEVARPWAVMLWNARVVMVIQKESVVSKCQVRVNESGLWNCYMCA